MITTCSILLRTRHPCMKDIRGSRNSRNSRVFPPRQCWRGYTARKMQRTILMCVYAHFICATGVTQKMGMATCVRYYGVFPPTYGVYCVTKAAPLLLTLVWKERLCLNRMPSSQMSFVFDFPWSVVYESLNCGHENPNTCMDLG